MHSKLSSFLLASAVHSKLVLCPTSKYAISGLRAILQIPNREAILPTRRTHNLQTAPRAVLRPIHSRAPLQLATVSRRQLQTNLKAAALDSQPADLQVPPLPILLMKHCQYLAWTPRSQSSAGSDRQRKIRRVSQPRASRSRRLPRASMLSTLGQPLQMPRKSHL
jgi:hypothetical protein